MDSYSRVSVMPRPTDFASLFQLRKIGLLWAFRNLREVPRRSLR